MFELKKWQIPMMNTIASGAINSAVNAVPATIIARIDGMDVDVTIGVTGEPNN